VADCLSFLSCPFPFKTVKRPLVPEMQCAFIGQPFILELEARVKGNKWKVSLLVVK